MYTSYWNMQSRPFDNISDSRFFFPGETHQAALMKLRYALENRVAGALLAGPAGVGKSLLIESLFEELPEEFGPRAVIRFPQMSPAELLAYLAEELTGRKADPSSIDQSLRAVQGALAKGVKQSRHAVVVIDEAHLLRETDALETVRLLMNFQPGWTVLLVAQPLLLPGLERMPGLEERLAVQSLLKPFSVKSTAAYVHHRLAAGGAAAAEDVFEPDALRVIHERSDGIPRRINRLGDLALLIGYAEERPRITADHVHAVADELLANTSSRRNAA
jgi:general secretion pathway protein A